MPHHEPLSVLITGGSSGIGEALALLYAKPGCTLFICGLNELRLTQVAKKCEKKGATVFWRIQDVTNQKTMANWIIESDQKQPIDLVIANAGVSGGNDEDMESVDQTIQIMGTNFFGVLYSLIPTIEIMKKRRKGQIAIVSSLAGLKGFPGAPAYCASKAAIKIWGDALRPSLKVDGINLSVICPGFVGTRMTDQNKFPMPFLMSADRAARIIKKSLKSHKPLIFFPKITYLAIRFLNLLPAIITDKLLYRLPKKQKISD